MYRLIASGLAEGQKAKAVKRTRHKTRPIFFFLSLLFLSP